MTADGDREQLAELFAPLGGVGFRRMFGGTGIFKDGLMFAMLNGDGVLWFKGDAETAPAFAAEGCEQWTPNMRGRVHPMPYWRAPERLFDEPEEFAEWARRAYEVARRTAKPKTRTTAARPKAAKPKTARPKRVR